MDDSFHEKEVDLSLKGLLQLENLNRFLKYISTLNAEAYKLDNLLLS